MKNDYDAEELELWDVLDRYRKRDGSALDTVRAMTADEKDEFCQALWQLGGRLDLDVWGAASGA